MLVPFITLIVAIPAHAQEPPSDVPITAPINVDAPVTDTISNRAPFDVWEFSTVSGEQYRAEMQASGGLAPLLGLRDPNGDIVMASNQFEDGSIQDARPDDDVSILFEIPTDGSYALVATRVGTDNGTTTGSYTLTLTLIAGPPQPDNTYIDVTFRCGAASVTTALVVEFGDESEPSGRYVMTAYGFDGFDPVLRIGGDDGTSGAPCEMAAPAAPDLALEFDSGSGEPVALASSTITGVAVYTLDMSEPGPVRVTVGSRGGLTGRFALHIAGLAIESAGDFDLVVARSGPFATSEPVTMWMLRDGLSRLDPSLDVPDDIDACADVALRTCGEALFGASVRVASGSAESASTNRLDAVARLATGTSDPVAMAAVSQNGRTTGAYVLWFLGALPEPD